ncbi:MAG: glutamate--tRNA ligase family protein [Verrucomicrobiae bacterium]|nr:glutamate--tRNA ligase family protein [Verrucomicrobiae bacterium]
MSHQVRTRFAPSPTGLLHIGSARAALFNWIYARKHGGTFVLRVEDTDHNRNTQEAEQVIFDGLHWLGLDWDEGPQKGGSYGPYYQSERGEIYEKYLSRLEKNGHLYEDHGAIRFRSPREKVMVNDLICGNIEFDLTNPATHPDITIRRPDGSWIFHFVNVVDDIEMQISHVIRGEDHLSNTPKHLELYRALEATPPIFAHTPLILNRDGTKMSKRDKGVNLGLYPEEGYAPEAVRNYLCLLGWSPKDNREIIDMEEIIRLFDLPQINRRSAAFDTDKCFWMNGQYLLHMDLARYTELALPFLEKAGLHCEDWDYLEKVLAIVKPKVKMLHDLPEWVRCFFTDDFPFDAAAVEKNLSGAADRLTALAEAFTQLEPWTTSTIEARLKETAATLGVKTGELIHPARVAASGRSVGAGLYEMFEILGRDKTVKRLRDGAERADG